MIHEKAEISSARIVGKVRQSELQIARSPSVIFRHVLDAGWWGSLRSQTLRILLELVLLAPNGAMQTWPRRISRFN
jgi:hypothetical protein